MNLVAEHVGFVTMCSTTKFTVLFFLFSMCESITLVYKLFFYINCTYTQITFCIVIVIATYFKLLITVYLNNCTAVERLFSKSSLVALPRHNCLNDEHFEQLLLLEANNRSIGQSISILQYVYV